MSNTVDIAKKYTKLEEALHALKLPDTLVGGNKTNIYKKHTLEYLDDTKDISTAYIVEKDVCFVPALFKIFDEIVVNARDRIIEDPTCNEIRVTIDKDKISVMNNGENGLEVLVHPVEKIYIPEFVFCYFRTSSNYTDNVKRITGGKNGLGAKATNVFSKQFNIEVVDMKRKLKYDQTIENNLSKINKPTITPIKGKQKSYCKISFQPDYPRFMDIDNNPIQELSEEMEELFKKRVYDLAAIAKSNVYLNDQLIQFKSFLDYVKKYYVDNENVEFACDYLEMKKINTVSNIQYKLY